MANVTNKIFVDKMGGRSSTQYVGTAGEIFYDPAVGDLRLSDGSTVGGKTLTGSEQDGGVYRGFQAGVNMFRNGGDGDIAQIIIHNAQGPVDYINYTTDTNNDDFYATNLTQQHQQNGPGGNNDPASKFVMMNLYCSNTNYPAGQSSILSVSDVRTFVRKFIDTVMFDEQDNQRNNLNDVKDAFYENKVALRQSLPDGILFENFAFDDYRRIHWPEYNTPAGVTDYADIFVIVNNLDNTQSNDYNDVTQIQIGKAGSGFEIGDVITLSGDQLGGVNVTNDMTIEVTALKQGGVTAMTMTNAGTGFNPTVYMTNTSPLDGGTGSGCAIYIQSCDAAGAIVQYQLRNGGGSGYSVGDILTVNNGGTTAEFEVTAVGTDGIADFNITGTIQRAPINGQGYWPEMMIGDGEQDQYDNGNFLSTSNSVNIVRADLSGNKMTIVDTIKSGVNLYAGMLCTVKTDDYNGFTFRLLSQATDDQNVWYTNNNNQNYEGIVVRIDGIPYGNGSPTGSNAFGGESSYVSLYDDSIFALVAFGGDTDSVYYNGEMGADSSGYKEVSTVLGSRTIDYTVKSIPQVLVDNNNYLLQSSDAGKHIYYNDGGNNTVWLNAASSESFPIGTAITIVSGGDGWTYIRPDDNNIQIWGAGFNTTSGWFYIPENSMATLLKIGKDKWMLSGAGLGNDD